MANQREFTKVQEVYDRPQKILVGTYTAKSGQVKNKYVIDPEAKVIKTIIHPINHRRVR